MIVLAAVAVKDDGRLDDRVGALDVRPLLIVEIEERSAEVVRAVVAQLVEERLKHVARDTIPVLEEERARIGGFHCRTALQKPLESTFLHGRRDALNDVSMLLVGVALGF